MLDCFSLGVSVVDLLELLDSWIQHKSIHALYSTSALSSSSPRSGRFSGFELVDQIVDRCHIDSMSSLPSSPSSSALPIVEGAAAEVLEEIVQTRVDERVAEAVDVAQRQLREEVNDEVDVRILENASTEHAKVEAERRRVAELERKLSEAERKAALAGEAELRAAQAERRRREAAERASVLEADLNAMRAREMRQSVASTPVAPATVISSRRFAAPVMTPISTRRDGITSSAAPVIAAERVPIQRNAIDAEVKRVMAERDAAVAQMVAERNASVAHVTALQNALHEERIQAQMRAQLQSQNDVAQSSLKSSTLKFRLRPRILDCPARRNAASMTGSPRWKYTSA
jgi:hypothetical protein